ncbi:helix-turn-helix transcriptional regulator [Streptomyces xanthii]|uniref:Helix-turn-helix domain-containing protein n=1 Tax=Streptomyces xanthii TaxID=2768069 RepID=A0A7H1BFX8_9ACTN|nr:helix-turn-helix transcriptional regulator [Streptomyces xanthii]QNS07633.1 helix-turn-helix domain-containing protein [Streptomyces xanthii]
MTSLDPRTAPGPDTGGEARRRSELGAFLRRRRERVGPAEVGLPEGTRRRTPGLRREEVAQLSGIGVAWYTWLEQGRRINPSVQVLDAIARTLKLDRTERDHLYRLAGVPSVPLDAPATAPGPPGQQAILDALTPLPATLVTARYDVLAYNEAYAALDPGLTLLPPGDRNVLWHLFTAEERLQPLVEWEREVSFMVAQLRAEFGYRMRDAAWTGFVRRLSEASPRFAEMWARHEVAAPAARVKSFWTVDGERLGLRATGFAATADPGTRMWVYTPEDADTERLLGELVGRLRSSGPAALLERGARSGGGRQDGAG